ncbi:unnamed protein product, partial [Leptidea sinapis]
PQEQSQTESM